MSYSLEIISESKKNKDSVFRKYELEDESVIGVTKNEPFMIRFKNNSSQAVQVRLSIDGTDICSGEVADTKVNDNDMFLVKRYGTLELNAFPESYDGGARFVFTNPESGVSVNTHGNTEAQGLIGVAVFREEAVHVQWYGSPYTTINQHYWGSPGYPRLGLNDSGGTFSGTIINDYSNYSVGDVTLSSVGPTASTGTLRRSREVLDGDSKGLDTTKGGDSRENFNGPSAAGETKEIEKLAVGAGEYVEQKLQTVKGLDKPVLDTIVQVRYMAWSELQGKLAKFKPKRSNAFPGDPEPKSIDLSSVPRTDSTAKKEKAPNPRFV